MSYKQKKEVIKNVKKLKGSDIFINEDFCFETMQRRKELWEEGKRLRSEDQIIFLNYRSIVVRGEEIVVINSTNYSLKVNSASI